MSSFVEWLLWLMHDIGTAWEVFRDERKKLPHEKGGHAR